MMIKHSGFAVLSAVASLLVFATPKAATAQAEAAIRQLPIEKWCAAEAARDLDAKMALFTSDVVFLPPGAPAVVGKGDLRAFHETGWKNTQWRCTGTVDEVKVLGEWGFARGTFSGDFTSSDGATKRFTGKFINVMRQEGGQWKIARVIWNND
jgi:uncharacterized protein (TIGR02246 family)